MKSAKQYKRTADEYADFAERHAKWAWREDADRLHALMAGQLFATLAVAAATLEAARLTLDAQASNLLSALEEPDPGVCIGCGCVANIDRGGILVCEEYPGCSALMESSK